MPVSNVLLCFLDCHKFASERCLINMSDNRNFSINLLEPMVITHAHKRYISPTNKFFFRHIDFFSLIQFLDHFERQMIAVILETWMFCIIEDRMKDNIQKRKKLGISLYQIKDYKLFFSHILKWILVIRNNFQL